jgi:hypothetical protein
LGGYKYSGCKSLGVKNSLRRLSVYALSFST